MRCAVFVDMNNIQSAINKGDARDRQEDPQRGYFRIDWVKFGPVVTQICSKALAGILAGEMSFEETRIYGSYQGGDSKHLAWSRHMARQPGVKVSMFERQYIEPQSDIQYIEKGLYSSMVTDMLMMGMTKMYDIAILGSSDLELLPAVAALARSGIKVIHLSATGNIARISEECWADVDIFAERSKYKFLDSKE